MTYVITEACIGVKGEGCISVCPAFCIVNPSLSLAPGTAC